MKSDDDNPGTPEHPIYSNYSNRLWTARARHEAAQLPDSSGENTDGPLLPLGQPSPSVDQPRRGAEIINRKLAA
ncbi:MAG: hypothetical protein QOF02_393 [Blastocatellia bacterium]|nr:hypothetical protein [Blastocatellia bacterium]